MVVKVKDGFFYVKERPAFGSPVQIDSSWWRLVDGTGGYRPAPLDAHGDGGRFVADEFPVLALLPDQIAIGKLSLAGCSYRVLIERRLPKVAGMDGSHNK